MQSVYTEYEGLVELERRVACDALIWEYDENIERFRNNQPIIRYETRRELYEAYWRWYFADQEN